jgi:hypothetical protein
MHLSACDPSRRRPVRELDSEPRTNTGSAPRNFPPIAAHPYMTTNPPQITKRILLQSGRVGPASFRIGTDYLPEIAATAASRMRLCNQVDALTIKRRAMNAPQIPSNEYTTPTQKRKWLSPDGPPANAKKSGIMIATLEMLINSPSTTAAQPPISARRSAAATPKNSHVSTR